MKIKVFIYCLFLVSFCLQGNLNAQSSLLKLVDDRSSKSITEEAARFDFVVNKVNVTDAICGISVELNEGCNSLPTKVNGKKNFKVTIQGKRQVLLKDTNRGITYLPNLTNTHSKVFFSVIIDAIDHSVIGDRGCADVCLLNENKEIIARSELHFETVDTRLD